MPNPGPRKPFTLPELQKLCFETAKAKGWCDPSPSVIEQLCLIHSEISEALEELRNGRSETEIYYEGDKPCGFIIELADTQIRLADLAYRVGGDLDEAVYIKNKYNQSRP